MKIYKEQIDLRSHGTTPTFINITPQVKEAIAKSGIQSGIVTIISPHTTCSVFFEEFVHDLTEDGTEFLQVGTIHSNLNQRGLIIDIIEITVFDIDKLFNISSNNAELAAIQTRFTKNRIVIRLTNKV